MELSSPSPLRRRVRIPGPIVGLVLGLLFGLAASACGPADGESEQAGPSSDELAATDESTTGDGEESTGEIPPAVPESFFDGSVTVVVPNSPGTVSTEGSQRIMAALVGDGPNAYLGGPDLPVTVRYALLETGLEDDLDGDVGGEVTGHWLTTTASELGLYVAPYEFERAGRWEVTVLAGGREVGGALVEVVDESVVPSIGDPAPASVTPTASTFEELISVSTDPVPDPGFYQLSLDEAVSNGRPTVVAFATPAFCRTALCGPTLEIVKAAAAGRTDIDVVHVEPFDIEQAIGGVLEPIDAMAEWGLVTEPWVFVVDADGRIAAGFEGIIGRDELETVLDRLP